MSSPINLFKPVFQVTGLPSSHSANSVLFGVNKKRKERERDTFSRESSPEKNLSPFDYKDQLKKAADAEDQETILQIMDKTMRSDAVYPLVDTLTSMIHQENKDIVRAMLNKRPDLLEDESYLARAFRVAARTSHEFVNIIAKHVPAVAE
jgi:hypothetical protein